MWLVSKGARHVSGLKPLAPALRETLHIWYTGQGDARDEEAALQLVRHARKSHCWIACDCRSELDAPMLSPALLTEADTYYLRRLTGRKRAEHAIDCPFFREQVMATTLTGKRPSRNPPDAWFSVLRPPAMALAQQPDDDRTPRDSASHGVPRLAKLLWRLLEISGRNVIEPVEGSQRDIATEFAAIRRVAEKIEVAPGIPLSRVLFTHAKDWHSQRIFAVLREQAKSWPKGHEPQAFLLVFARKVHERSIETSDGVIELSTRLRHPGTRAQPISGPDLTLVAIGERADTGGYAALRAWAQPVHNGHRFIPVDSDFDREIVEALVDARRILATQNITLRTAKPVFDTITPDGSVRPCWIATMSQDGRTITALLETPASGDSDPRRRSALAFHGPIIDLDEESIPYLTARLAALWHNTAS